MANSQTETIAPVEALKLVFIVFSILFMMIGIAWSGQFIAANVLNRPPKRIVFPGFSDVPASSVSYSDDYETPHTKRSRFAQNR